MSNQIGLLVGGQSATITRDGQAAGHLPDVLDKCGVADDIDCRLVVKQERAFELDLVNLDVSNVGKTDVGETQLVGTSIDSFIVFCQLTPRPLSNHQT